MTKKFLNEVYELKTVAKTQALYDDWAASYDSEVDENGYVTPGRIASALAGLLPNHTLPVLDFGCGTGISGVAMNAAGFTTVDGCDLSKGMLKQARQKQVYREIWHADPENDFPVKRGAYAAIIAVGVVSKGAAPPETMDMLIHALAPGGLFAFSFNDHTLEDPRFEARVEKHVEGGNCKVLLCEDGDHLPGIGLRSTIFVLKRL